MARQRRTFSIDFKVRIAQEAIRKQKTINELASEYGVHPNLIRKWKKHRVSGILSGVQTMSYQTQRSAFIGEYGPADWLSLKEEILDLKAEKLEQILPLIQERARNSQEELEILDVASGEGQFTMQLYEASKSSKIIALDNYPKYMKTAKERYRDIKQIQCLGNLYDMPFGNETFDIVATRSTLDIMDGPGMFKEMVRVLKPKGWIYASLVYDSTYKFAPGPDPDLEMQIQRAYNRYAIEWGVSYGIKAVNGSRGGRFLPLYAWDNGLSIIKLVAADWFLYPNPEFTQKERAVLYLQLDMIYHACKRVQEPEYAIESNKLDEWYQRIQNDIARNRTTYTSHQFSILAEKP
jgi:transposase-like protein